LPIDLQDESLLLQYFLNEQPPLFFQHGIIEGQFSYPFLHLFVLSDDGRAIREGSGDLSMDSLIIERLQSLLGVDFGLRVISHRLQSALYLFLESCSLLLEIDLHFLLRRIEKGH
jgi:hypothetical protein